MCSRGSGLLARSMTGAKRLLPARIALLAVEGALSEKGADNGKDVSLLCETFSVMRFGRANRLLGKSVRAFLDKSRDVRAMRSASVLGTAVSLLMCNCRPELRVTDHSGVRR